MAQTLKLNYTAASDRGLVRNNNEDSAYAGDHLLVLADGMGGHAAGEVASQLLVTKMEHLDRPAGDNDMLALLGAAADDANAAIAETVRQRPETDGMGTTCTALMFNGHEFGLCHVGDSRGYRLRDGELEQITVDDTYVQSLVASGELDPEDVSTHPQKSLILKAYTGRPVEPTLQMIDARPGDRLLLCSDGLSDPVTSATIKSTLQEGSPEDAATQLVALALRSGGPDNVTVVVADVVDTDKSPEIAFPTSAVAAGALALTPHEVSHPDTAAGRAAALQHRPQVIEPNSTTHTEKARTSRPSAGDSVDDDEDSDRARGRGGRRGRNWTLAVVILVVIAALVAGAWWAYASTKDNYYIATNDADELVIERGANISIFGRDLHETYQKVCLTSDNEVRISDVGEPDSDARPDDSVLATPGSQCQEFSLSDLPASVRSSIPNLDSGSYSTVTQELRRLSDKVLPVCVDREKDPQANEDEDPAADDPEAAPTTEPDDKPRDDGGLSTPGVNCREVK